MIDKEIKCAHPDCGRGFHAHRPRNAPPIPAHPKPRAELDTAPGRRRRLAPGARVASAHSRGGALPGERRTCRVCNKEKDGSEFYASSGRVCKMCFNARAIAQKRALLAAGYALSGRKPRRAVRRLS